MKTALVLEGGSLRCMFSAGVVDVMMEQGISFDAVYGVSAGSLTGVNYVSNQPKRTMRVNIDFVGDRDYLGMKTLVFNKSIFNFDYLFDNISNTYLPLDRKTFEESPVDFTCAATSIETGEALYFNKHTCDDIYTAMVASSSMPLLSPIVDVCGTKCLDGGIKVAVPYQKAIDDGCDKIVVVPTREHGFRKPFTSRGLAGLYLNRYFRYPDFVKSLIDTPRMYDRQMNEIDALQRAGCILVIRPERPVTVSRTEKDIRKLMALYQEGRETAENTWEALARYLSA